MYAPNSEHKDVLRVNLVKLTIIYKVFTLNLEQMLSGTPLDAAIGVLQITVQAARSLKGIKMGGGAPDPYVTISISGRAVLAQTEWKTST